MSFSEHLRQLQEDLLQQARRPNIYGYKPWEVQEAFHRSTLQENLVIGGNRVGKTVCGAAETIYRLKGESPYKAVAPAPTRCRSVSMDFTSGVNMIVKPEIQRWIPPSLLINGSWEDSYNNNDRLLTCSNGSFLEFKSYDQDLIKFAGTSRHWIWFDEEPPEDLFEENFLRLMDVNGDYAITMTPLPEYGGGLTWVYDTLYLPGKQGEREIGIFEGHTDQNPYNDAEVVKKMFAKMTDEQRAARQRGEFVQMGGLVFPKFNPEIHVTDKMIYNPKDLRIRLFASMDHGLNDPTAWLWHLVHDNGTVFTFREHFEEQKTIPHHAQRVKEIEREIGRQPQIRWGDPTIKKRSSQSGLSNQLFYQQHGVHIAVNDHLLTEAGKEASIVRMVDYLDWDDKKQPKWFIHQSCTNLIREMRRWKYKTRDSKKAQDKVNKGEKPVDKDDHAISAARFFFGAMPDLRNARSIDTRRAEAGQAARQIIHPSTAFHQQFGVKDEGLLKPPEPTVWNQVIDDNLGGIW